LSVIAVLITT